MRSPLPPRSNYGICKKIWKGSTREWTGVVTRVLLIKVTVYIKVLIHRARGRANGNVKHSQREAPVLVTQQSGIKVLQVFQKRNFHERSSAKSRRRPSGQREHRKCLYRGRKSILHRSVRDLYKWNMMHTDPLIYCVILEPNARVSFAPNN